MTKTELITRLCEMAAELADLTRQFEADKETHAILNMMGQHFQTGMEALQNRPNEGHLIVFGN